MARSASGGMYALPGTRWSRRQTRSLEDGRKVVGMAGATASKYRLRNRGVEVPPLRPPLPRKAAGRISATLFSRGRSVSDSSDGNGFCSSGDSFAKSELPTVRSTSHMRSRWCRAAMILSPSSSSSSSGDGDLSPIVSSLYRMTMGRGGQQSRVFLTGVPYVHKSRRSSLCRDANTSDRHWRHTCISLCHPHEGLGEASL